MTGLLMSGDMIAHACNGSRIGRNRRMHMALTTHRWTRADLERLPDDGNRYEVIDGDLLVSPAPRPAHERLVMEFGRALDEYCRRVKGVQASFGRPAMVTATSEVEPDIVVRASVAPPPDRWDDAPVPLLVVEVFSESTRRNDAIRKRAFYLANGVAEYWMVDGDARQVRVVDAHGERTESATLRWAPTAGSVPLDLDLATLFIEALGSPD
ncbi:MAG: Uma2 family endonuclease [Gemmatimonadaceae bacterium]